MTKQFIASLCLLAIVGVGVGVGVKGADVDCTVTPGIISVVVTPPSVDYGTMGLNDTNNSGIISATVGSLSTSLTIQGVNANPKDTTNDNIWVLSSTVGVDQYIHAYTTSTDELTGADLGTEYTTNWVYLTTSPQTLASSIADTTLNFQLDMRTPESSSASIYSEHSTTITVLATAG